MTLLFKPFKIPNYIGAAGTVVEIQIFATFLNTTDNKRIVVPNGKLSNDILTNYSKNSTRRVDINFSVGYNDDLDKAKSVLVEIAKAQEKILKNPNVFVEIIEY